MDIRIPFASKNEIAEKLSNLGHAEHAADIEKIYFGTNADSIIVNFKSAVSIEFVKDLRKIGKDLNLKGIQSQCTQFIGLIEDPEAGKIKSIKSLKQGLIEYFKVNAIKGWLYHDRKGGDGTPLPYLISGIVYQEPNPTIERPETVIIRLKAVSPMINQESEVSLEASFVKESTVNRTIPEVLASQGYVKETEALTSEYEYSQELYKKFQSQFGEQFISESDAFGFIDSETGAWHSGKYKLGGGPRSAKLVNDEEALQRELYLRRSISFWEDQEVEQGSFDTTPVHPYLYFFDLEEHKHVWVHSTKVSEYQYDSTLKDKIVLPQEHRDLIDILVDDMDVVMDDFVEGKSGGSTILCMGAAGLGKTLTAEIYSEVIKRPLYRVHSGQLGTCPDQIEKRLAEILKRSERWKSVLLIDEADVYIRERDNSMSHNAIVAAFLRKLEYFSGLLFLTTNRSNDVDDAILSRCIAVIKYELPTPDAAVQIWNKLADKFEIEMPKGLAEKLAEKYPKASGRDIKELLKLAAKYKRQKGKSIGEDLFRQCAMFRGISTVE